MSEEPVTKRRGRPPLDPSEKKRRNVTFRLRDSFREEIERRATENGRSMSEEIETILERFVPIADVINQEFVDEVRSIIKEVAFYQKERKTVVDIAWWNAELLRKVIEDIEEQKAYLEQRRKSLQRINEILLMININETDRMAISDLLAGELHDAADLIEKTLRIPKPPASLGK